MKSCDDIEARAGRLHQGGEPAVGNAPTDERGADNEGAHASIFGLPRAHVGQAQVQRVARQTKLPAAEIFAPVDDALGCFGVGGAFFVAQK